MSIYLLLAYYSKVAWYYATERIYYVLFYGVSNKYRFIFLA